MLVEKPPHEIPDDETIDIIIDRLVHHCKMESILNYKNQFTTEERDKKLYKNTVLFFEMYRSVKWEVEYWPKETASELGIPLVLDSFIDNVIDKLDFGNKKLASDVKRVMWNYIHLRILDRAMFVLSKKPKDGKKLHDILYLAYIDDHIDEYINGLGTDEYFNDQDIDDTVDRAYRSKIRNYICKQLNMNPRTFYRLKKQSISIVSKWLWDSPVCDLFLYISSSYQPPQR
jgi:hypothetical protein